MDTEHFPLEDLLPNIATQFRSALSNLHLAAAQLVPASQREADPELDAKAALLDRSFYQLLRLVNNLSAAACLEGEEDWPEQDWDIVEIISSLCDECTFLSRLTGVDLRFFCPMEHHICAINRGALEQLMFQLLSNGIKFTPSGGVVIVELKRSGIYLRLSVMDTGRGIEAERLPYLFDRFLQGGLLDPQPHGLGLGLALCRRIAEAMGGGIMAESRPGKGSRFTVSIPDRRCGTIGVSDVRVDYAGGFNRTLLALADAMPTEAFRIRNEG